MDMVIFVKDGLYLLDVVHRVEDDIVCRITDADMEVVSLQQGKVGKIVHESLEDAADFQPTVNTSGNS